MQLRNQLQNIGTTLYETRGPIPRRESGVRGVSYFSLRGASLCQQHADRTIQHPVLCGLTKIQPTCTTSTGRRPPSRRAVGHPVVPVDTLTGGTSRCRWRAAGCRRGAIYLCELALAIARARAQQLPRTRPREYIAYIIYREGRNLGILSRLSLKRACVL